jgi:hypothetical protein
LFREARWFPEFRLCYWKNNVINDCRYFRHADILGRRTAGPNKAV